MINLKKLLQKPHSLCIIKWKTRFYYSQRIFQFNEVELREQVANLQLKTIQNNKKDNQKISDVLFEIEYQLEQQGLYHEKERNLIMMLNIGDINLRVQNLDFSWSVLDELQQYLEAYDSDQDLKQDLMAQLIYRKAIIQQKKNNFDEALQNFQNIIDFIQELSNKIDDKPIKIDFVQLLGNCYEKKASIYKNQLKDFDLALENYQKALSITEQILPMNNIVNLRYKSMIGDIYMKKQNLQKAQDILQETFSQLIYYKQYDTKSIHLLQSTGIFLLMTYLQLKTNFQDALRICQEIEKVLQENQQQVQDLNWAHLYEIKSNIYFNLKNYDEQFNYTQKAIKFASNVLPQDNQYLQTLFKTRQKIMDLLESNEQKQEDS